MTLLEREGRSGFGEMSKQERVEGDRRLGNGIDFNYNLECRLASGYTMGYSTGFRNSGLEHLPSEVIHLIEHYLPLESIRDFSIVNKSIYSLIYTDAHWKEIYTQSYICPYYYMESSSSSPCIYSYNYSPDSYAHTASSSLSSFYNNNFNNKNKKDLHANKYKIQHHRNIQRLAAWPTWSLY